MLQLAPLPAAVKTAQAMVEAGVEGRDVQAVSATNGPGLVGALLVGASAGRALALSLGVPAIAVQQYTAVMAVLMELIEVLELDEFIVSSPWRSSGFR